MLLMTERITNDMSTGAEGVWGVVQGNRNTRKKISTGGNVNGSALKARLERRSCLRSPRDQKEWLVFFLRLREGTQAEGRPTGGFRDRAWEVSVGPEGKRHDRGLKLYHREKDAYTPSRTGPSAVEPVLEKENAIPQDTRSRKRVFSAGQRCS